jgi:probable addiction module antidote protein
MARKRKREKFRRFDAASHLKSERDAVGYLQACMEEADGDAAFIAAALGDVARAYGMSKLAREVGMSRVGLHKALDKRGNPSLDAILRVTSALGLKLVPHAA